jgi:hypothetical protein
MKIEKEFSKVAVSDAMMYFLLTFMFYVLAMLVLLIVYKGNISSFKETAVVWAFFPILWTWMHIWINRKGVMTISGFENIPTLIKVIEAGANKFDFLVIERTDITINFDHKYKWIRFLNIFLRETLKVAIGNDTVLVFGKKNALTRIESDIRKALKYGHIN